MKSKYISLITAFIITLVSIGLSNIKQYTDISNNPVLIAFQIIIFTGLGYIIGDSLDSNEEPKKQSKKGGIKFEKNIHDFN